MKPDRPRVLILHHSPPQDPATGKPQPWRESDAGVLDEVKAVAAALDALGLAHRTAAVARLSDVPPVLAAAPEEVVFNLVESLAGAPADANFIPALCRAFAKVSTGGDTPCLVLAQDKWQTKAALFAAGLLCPSGKLVPVGKGPPPLWRSLDGFLIVKPLAADASEGIDAGSVVKRGAALRKALRRVHEEMGQAAIVEDFIEGREFNLSLIERRGAVEVLPIAETDFSAFPPDQPRIVGYAAKWLPESFEYKNTPRIIPARLRPQQEKVLWDLAMEAWRALGCRDYARVDVRVDRDGGPFILEVNPNPDLSPGDGFPAALAAAGIRFEEFVEIVIENACRRKEEGQACASRREIEAPPAPRQRKDRTGPPAVTIRYSEPRDREAILGLLAETGFFRPDELAVAQEVLDDALAKGPGGHYQSFVAQEGGQVVGWVSFGPTPCTVGTFDIYWIGVSPRRQGRGIGAALMEYAEARIAERGGRLAVVETSGRAVYDPTRRFYYRLGYREAGRIRDFYAPGDDKVVYTKCLA